MRVSPAETLSTSKCICVSLAIAPDRGANRGVGGASALELKTAARSELPLELHHAAEPDEAIIVGVTAARIEHAHAVDYGCDGRAKPASEVLAAGADPEVVVAARAPRLGHDPELAGARLRHDGLA